MLQFTCPVWQVLVLHGKPLVVDRLMSCPDLHKNSIFEVSIKNKSCITESCGTSIAKRCLPPAAMESDVFVQNNLNFILFSV